MNADRFLTCLLSVVIVAICFVGAKCTRDYEDEIDRLRHNEYELTRTDSVSCVVSNSKKETEQLIGEQGRRALEQVNVKPTKVETITELVTETVFDTIVIVKEKVVHDTIVQCFQFVDPYLSMGGEIKNGKLDFELSMRDSLSVVCHKKKKKFLFIPYYSRKELELDIVNTSPYSKIVYGRYVKVN